MKKLSPSRCVSWLLRIAVPPPCPRPHNHTKRTILHLRSRNWLVIFFHDLGVCFPRRCIFPSSHQKRFELLSSSDSEQPLLKIVNDSGLVVRVVCYSFEEKSTEHFLSLRRYYAHNSLELERSFLPLQRRYSPCLHMMNVCH